MSHRIYSHPTYVTRTPGFFKPVAPNTIPDWQAEKIMDEIVESFGEGDGLKKAATPVTEKLLPRSTQFTTPSGLTLEVMPRRPRSLLPLALTTLLIWSAIGVAVWFIYTLNQAA